MMKEIAMIHNLIHYLKKDQWSGYVVGTLLATLSLGSFIFLNHMLGTSSTFITISAALLYLIAPNYVTTNTYYVSHLDQSSWINWQAALVIGLFVGAYVAGRLYKKITPSLIPPLWKANFGSNPYTRAIGAFIGGVFIMFGARLAGGCTSGHAITGGMQLVVSSWIFMIAVFAIGIPTAFILYPRKG